MSSPYKYQLRRGPAPGRPGDTVYAGTYTSKEAAQGATVTPPEEWIWIEEDRVWFHGGGTQPGEWFVIIKVVAG